MEPAVGEVRSSGRDGSNLLGLPGLCPWEDDDEPLGLGGIKPKTSPIPRRRSSEFSCSDDESQPPPSGSRRVSFADAFGLSLVSVKQFNTWATCGPSDPLEGDLRGSEAKEYFLSQLFTLPSTREELIQKVQEQKLELESLELLPCSTTLKGTIRVLNLCFDKLVYIRTSLDGWSSHFDLLAEFLPGWSDGQMDCFSFKLTLVPPFGEQGARVDFCLRYETPFGTFWANNSGQNYVLFCHEKVKDQDQNEKKNTKKSCLKSVSYDCSTETSPASSTENIPEIILNCGMTAVSEPAKEETMHEEQTNLQEEDSRNHRRRSRRKAARLSKVKQYFAEREKTDVQQIAKDTSEAAVKANEEEPHPDNVGTPSDLSAPQTDKWTEVQDRVSFLPPEKIKNQKWTSGSADSDSKQAPAPRVQTQDKGNVPVRHCEVTSLVSQAVPFRVDSVNCNKSAVSSVSQSLDNSQNKETPTGQAVSVTQQLLECQTSETAITTNLEKVWECLEKGAMGRMGSPVGKRTGEDTTSSRNEAKHTGILENKPESQSSGHHFTFETVVAPLYHQVFERMEMERRDFINHSKLSTGRSLGKLGDERLRAITYQSYPRTQCTETRPNSGTSEKHDANDVYQEVCRELCPPDLFGTKDSTEKQSDTNVNREPAETEAIFRNISGTDISEIYESKMITHKEPRVHSLPSQLECLNRASLESLEECIPPHQEEHQPQDMMALQRECLQDSPIDDILHNRLPPENLQREHIPAVHMALTTASDLQSASVKISPSIVSESPSSADIVRRLRTEANGILCKEAETLQPQCSGGTQAPMESPFTEIPSSSKCLEDSHSLTADSSSFYAHISSDVTSNFIQTQSAPEPSQEMSSLTSIQIQSPDFTSFEDRPTAATVITAIIGGTNLIQSSENVCPITDGESLHISTETESDSDGREETDGSEGENINPGEGSPDWTLLRSPPADEGIKVLSSSDGLNSVPLEQETDIYEEHKLVEHLANTELDSTDDSEPQSVQVSEQPALGDEREESKQDGKEEQKLEEKLDQKLEEHEHKLLEEKKLNLEEQKQEEEEELEDEEQDKTVEPTQEAKEEEDTQQKPDKHDYEHEEPEEVDEINLEEQETLVEPNQDGKEEQKREEHEKEEEKEPEQEENEHGKPGEPKQEERAENDQNPKDHQHKQEEEKRLEEEEEEEEDDDDDDDDEHEEEEEPEEPRQEGKEGQKLKGDDQNPEQLKDKQEEQTLEDQKQAEEDLEEEEDDEDTFQAELLYIDEDEEEEAEMETKQNDPEQSLEEEDSDEGHLSLEVEAEEQDRVSRVSSVATAEKVTDLDSKLEVHLQLRQELQSPSRISEEGNSVTGKGEDTDSSQRSDLTGTFTSREEKVSCQTKEVSEVQETSEDIRKQKEKNVDEEATTESLTDDEMELYLQTLKSTQQPGFRGTASTGNYSRRSSMSRIWTMPSPLPSISESLDEDQPNESLEDLTQEEMTELEKATLPLMEEEEERLRRNVLWWREFFSSGNMSRMMGCAFVLLVFLVTAYYCDFVACFGLYLLALYWLYFRGESEPFKVGHPDG